MVAFKGASRDGYRLWLHYEQLPVTRPVMELKDFKRISLAPGASQAVDFVITPAKLSFIGLNMEEVVEPGWFEIKVGTRSLKYETVKREVVGR